MPEKIKKLALNFVNKILLLIFLQVQSTWASAFKPILINPTHTTVKCRLETATNKNIKEAKALTIQIEKSREQDIALPDEENKSKLHYDMLNRYYEEWQNRLKGPFNIFEFAVIAYDASEIWTDLEHNDSSRAQKVYPQLKKVHKALVEKTYHVFKETVDALNKINLKYDKNLVKKVEKKIKNFVFYAQETDWDKFVSCCDCLSEIFKPITHKYIVESGNVNLAQTYDQVPENKNVISNIIKRIEKLYRKVATKIEVEDNHELIPTFYAIIKKYQEINKYLAVDDCVYEKNMSECNRLKQKIDAIKLAAERNS